MQRVIVDGVGLMRMGRVLWGRGEEGRECEDEVWYRERFGDIMMGRNTEWCEGMVLGMWGCKEDNGKIGCDGIGVEVVREVERGDSWDDEVE